MKKLNMLMALFAALTFNNVFAQNPSQTPLTANEQASLKSLACKVMNVNYLPNGRVQFGDVSDHHYQLFLVKNISGDDLYIDFPEGHIGATAGIMQVLSKDAWSAYVYKQGVDYLRIENQDGIQSKVRPTWACQAGDSAPDSCQKLTYVCEVTETNAKGSPLQQIAVQIIQGAKAGGWLFQGYDGSSIESVLDWVVTSRYVSS